MAFKDDCCYLGRGLMYCKPCDTSGCGDNGFGSGFGLNFGAPKSHRVNTLGTFLGNVSDFTISPTSERVQRIFRSGNVNAPDCPTKIITGANVSITIECTNVENLTKALCGSYKEMPVCTTAPDCICWTPCPGPGGAVICEHEALEFEKPGIDEDSVTLKIINPDGSETDLVAGIDFIANCFHVKFLRNISLPLKSYIKISYNYDSKYTCIEGLTGQGSPVTLTFDGCTATEDGRFYKAKAYKVHLDPVDSFSFISDEIQNLTLTGILEPVDKYRLKDQESSGWFKIWKVDKGGNKK